MPSTTDLSERPSGDEPKDSADDQPTENTDDESTEKSDDQPADDQPADDQQKSDDGANADGSAAQAADDGDTDGTPTAVDSPAEGDGVSAKRQSMLDLTNKWMPTS